MDDVEKFVAHHRRQPDRNSDQPAERDLAIWFRKVLHAQVKVSHEDARRAYQIADTVPQLNKSVSTERRLSDLEEFIARTGRFPQLGSVTSVFGNGEERSLYLWASEVRRGRRVTDQHVVDRVTELHEQYKTTARRRRASGWT